MAKFDDIRKKKEKEAEKEKDKDADKKASDLKDFQKEVATKKLLTFYREPFFSRCFVCKKNFRVINDKMASCDHVFRITPDSVWVGACYMQDYGFELDETKIAEVESKYSMKVQMVELPPWMQKKEEVKPVEQKTG